jgi:hypothetical protein
MAAMAVTNRHRDLASLLLLVGGAITFLVVPLVAGGLFLFAMLLVWAFGGPADDLIIVGVIALVVAVDVLLILAWLRALRGSRVGLVLMGIAGAGLALYSTNAFLSFTSFPEEPDDPLFLSIFFLAIGAPAALAVGALLRLISLNRERLRPAE